MLRTYSLKSLIVVAVLATTAFSAKVSAFTWSDLNRLRETRVCYGCDLSKVELRGEKLIRYSMNGSDLTGAQLLDANLEESNLDRVKMKNANLSGVRMRFTILGRSDLQNVNFTNADLVGTLFISSRAMGADFSRANLGAANLKWANLTGARMIETKLFGAEFEGTNISSVDLSQTKGLTQEQLDGACGDMFTVLPEGMSVVYCVQWDGTMIKEPRTWTLPPLQEEQ